MRIMSLTPVLVLIEMSRKSMMLNLMFIHDKTSDEYIAKFQQKISL